MYVKNLHPMSKVYLNRDLFLGDYFINWNTLIPGDVNRNVPDKDKQVDSSKLSKKQRKHRKEQVVLYLIGISTVTFTTQI